MGVRYMQGTPWHIEYLSIPEEQKEEKRRSRKRCVFYQEDGRCFKNFDVCYGATHCRDYSDNIRKRKVLEQQISKINDPVFVDKKKEKPISRKDYSHKYPLYKGLLGQWVFHDTFGKGVLWRVSEEGMLVVAFGENEHKFRFSELFDEDMLTRLKNNQKEDEELVKKKSKPIQQSTQPDQHITIQTGKKTHKRDKAEKKIHSKMIGVHVRHKIHGKGIITNVDSNSRLEVTFEGKTFLWTYADLLMNNISIIK